MNAVTVLVLFFSRLILDACSSLCHSLSPKGSGIEKRLKCDNNYTRAGNYRLRGKRVWEEVERPVMNGRKTCCECL